MIKKYICFLNKYTYSDKSFDRVIYTYFLWLEKEL